MSEARLMATILGCGSSGGVPRLGGADGQGDWGACNPDNPKNRRTRCALLLERAGPEGKTRVLIDAGPDIRQQLLNAGVGALDAVMLTHDHADHVHGLDDLRPLVLRSRKKLDIWADPYTAGVVMQRFGYAFKAPEGSPYPPIYTLRQHDGHIPIEGKGGLIDLRAYEVEHGPNYQARDRVGGLAYTPDVSELPEAARAALQDLEVWIIDALQWKPHLTHAHIDKTLQWIEELRPKRAILTNLHNSVDYDRLYAYVPSGVEPAHDGKVIGVSL